MAWRRAAFTLSGVVIIAGLCAIGFRGNNIYSIDFSGGNEFILSFQEKPSLETIQEVAKTAAVGELTPSFQKPLGSGDERLKLQVPANGGEMLVEQLKQALPQCQFQLLQQTTIGSSVSSSLRWNALVSMALATIGILIYVALRFELSYGWGAIISTGHDVLATIGIYVLLGHQFSAPMIAATLMIIGYSINDTIIVFDRIREELPLHPFMTLRELVNFAISGTLSRTLLTSFTTLLAALSLYVFGVGVVRDFALIFIIGIVTGTFSSIFIASPIFCWFHERKREILERKSSP